MCIRDRWWTTVIYIAAVSVLSTSGFLGVLVDLGVGTVAGCLLYTSDAADERSSVDLGGRRILKKKKIE